MTWGTPVNVSGAQSFHGSNQRDCARVVSRLPVDATRPQTTRGLATIGAPRKTMTWDTPVNVSGAQAFVGVGYLLGGWAV